MGYLLDANVVIAAQNLHYGFEAASRDGTAEGGLQPQPFPAPLADRLGDLEVDILLRAA